MPSFAYAADACRHAFTLQPPCRRRYAMLMPRGYFRYALTTFIDKARFRQSDMRRCAYASSPSCHYYC